MGVRLLGGGLSMNLNFFSWIYMRYSPHSLGWSAYMFACSSPCALSNCSWVTHLFKCRGGGHWKLEMVRVCIWHLEGRLPDQPAGKRTDNISFFSFFKWFSLMSDSLKYYALLPKSERVLEKQKMPSTKK